MTGGEKKKRERNTLRIAVQAPRKSVEEKKTKKKKNYN